MEEKGKSNHNDRMTETEYLINREILEEIKFSPGKSARQKFLI